MAGTERSELRAPTEPIGRERSEAGGSGSSLEDIRVLVADDGAASRSQLVEMLSNWRMRPVPADSFDSALLALDQEPCALAIVGTKISGGRGLELVDSIRRRSSAAGPAVLILAPTADAIDAETCRALGIRACLRQPVEQCELLDAITTMLASDSLERLGVFSNQAPGPVVTGSGSSVPSAARRILVAEDNPVNQRVLVRMLERRGHSVVLVSNGREAVEAAEREKFDIALFDIQMPEMSGIEATAAIRARELKERERLGVLNHIPIVAITANAMKGDRETYLAAGMDGSIAKPVRQDELFETIENLSIIQVSASSITFDGALFEGDPQFLAEIVTLFLETYPELLCAIEEAVARRDADGVRKSAHTLKGAVANFGAKEIVDRAKALEMMGKSGDMSSADEGWRDLRDLMQAFVPELHTALKEVKQKQVVM